MPFDNIILPLSITEKPLNATRLPVLITRMTYDNATLPEVITESASLRIRIWKPFVQDQAIQYKSPVRDIKKTE